MKKEVESVMLLDLEIPFKVLSKSNFRYSKKNWKNLKNFEENLKFYILSKLDNYFISEKEGALFGIRIITNSKYDTGNLSKSILDALEGVIYENDKMVTVVISENNRSMKKDSFKLKVAIAENSDEENINEKLLKNLI